MGFGLFGLFLILAGINSHDWTCVFAVLGLATLIFCMRKRLALWGPNLLVLHRTASDWATLRQPPAMDRSQPREQVVRGSDSGSTLTTFQPDRRGSL
jgi:hypothetical protein